jgi:hypothetical protein
MTLGRPLPLTPDQAVADYCDRHGVSLTSEQRMALRTLIADREADAEHRLRNDIMRERAAQVGRTMERFEKLKGA